MHLKHNHIVYLNNHSLISSMLNTVATKDSLTYRIRIITIIQLIPRHILTGSRYAALIITGVWLTTIYLYTVSTRGEWCKVTCTYQRICICLLTWTKLEDHYGSISDLLSSKEDERLRKTIMAMPIMMRVISLLNDNILEWDQHTKLE